MSTGNIPRLSKDELLARARRIKPVFTDKAGKKHFMKPVDLETANFTWDPEAVHPMGEGVEELGVIATKHRPSSPWFFKPDIHEVLAQIPEPFLRDVTAFETRFSGEREDGMHIGMTTYYKGPLPQEVKNLPVIYKGEEIAAENLPLSPAENTRPSRERIKLIPKIHQNYGKKT